MSRLSGNELVAKFVVNHGVDEYRIVDISKLSKAENRGLSRAILLVGTLPKEYVRRLRGQVDYSIFSETEHRMDHLADELAYRIRKTGYQAISQSEKSIIERQEFYIEEKATPLPHKKIAVLSGLGWIGKNNLLVTEKYGCALCMCTLLTDMPLEVVSEKIQEVQCGNCQACKKICPAHVIKGTKWTVSTVRDEIVDVYKCETCLKCMAYCGFSQKYSRVE